MQPVLPDHNCNALATVHVYVDSKACALQFNLMVVLYKQ
jgi:hypothetical protein